MRSGSLRGGFVARQKAVQEDVSCGAGELGAGGAAIARVAAGRGAIGVLQHANVTLRTGALDWILSTPALHQWHHSTRIEGSNRNYGSTLIVWDVVFGTRRLPRDRRAPEALGLTDGATHPPSLWGQLIDPWRG